MIVSSNDHNMKDTPVNEANSNMPQENPPSYDYATESGSSYTGNDAPKTTSYPIASGKTMTQPLLRPDAPRAGPAYSSQPTYTPAPMVYNYVNPSTGERVASLLPPDHPEMICLQAGSHVPQTHYGLLGILAAVFWFPLGIGLCLLDRRVRCRRCGLVIDDGVCG